MSISVKLNRVRDALRRIKYAIGRGLLHGLGLLAIIVGGFVVCFLGSLSYAALVQPDEQLKDIFVFFLQDQNTLQTPDVNLTVARSFLAVVATGAASLVPEVGKTFKLWRNEIWPPQP